MTNLNEGALTVPRLPRLSHLEVVLLEAHRGASFERMRQALIASARNTTDGSTGAGVVSSLHDEYTYWSPTQEAISELMRLGWMAQAPVPSSRRYVDAYRASTYQLTAEGEEAIQELASNTGAARAKYLDTLTESLAAAHSGFAQLIEVANGEPLLIPEYTQERISSLQGSGTLTGNLAHDAISRMVEHWPLELAQPLEEDLAKSLKDALRRRFPENRVRQPSQKDVLDTVDDTVLGFVAKARGIRLDAISFNVCMSWASQLAVLEQSRYVEGWSGRTVWATAEVGEQGIRRRGFAEAEKQVISETRDGFRKLLESTSEGRASGYVPIYRVRAQAAFVARVNLRLVDMVLEGILSGSIHAPYEIKVALGRGTPPPRSERVFTHEGRRFFDIMIIE